MLNKSKIYSIQSEVDENNIDINNLNIIEIETIILNGLYKFSILGINQKNLNDTKDRIYSALRSQKLINLKSDNKKITVNLLPTNIDKKSNIYDLGIALSCMNCMGQINIDENIIAIGELSILGNIIESKLLIRSINEAIKNNIKIIICPEDDILYINNNQNNLIDLIKNYDIRFISSNNLSDLIENIKNKLYIELKNESNIIKNQYFSETKKYNKLKIKNVDILKIILSICTKRNIFIENNINCYIKKFIKNLNYYNVKIKNYELLKISSFLNITDDKILGDYTYPKIHILNNQIKKGDLNKLLNESLFGFNIIEDFMTINEESFYIIKKFHKSSIFCFYNSCPCGNNNIFFDNTTNNKCYCLQRNILKYRQKIKKIENNFFDFYIKNTSRFELKSEVEIYNSDDYLLINNIISDFRNISFEVKNSKLLDDFIENNKNIFEVDYLNIIIKLAKDINKFENIVNGYTDINDKKYSNRIIDLNQENINLAINLLKKDF